MEMRVSSYGSREELEKYCLLLDEEKRGETVIIGTRVELARYGLGPLTTVHGVPCRATDEVGGVVRAPATPPERIKGKGYGLNGRLTDLPTNHHESPL